MRGPRTVRLDGGFELVLPRKYGKRPPSLREQSGRCNNCNRRADCIFWCSDVCELEWKAREAIHKWMEAYVPGRIFSTEEAGQVEVGCKHRHNRRAAALDALETFFTSNPANTSTVMQQLRAALAVPLGRTPTIAEVESIIFTLIEERR